MFERKSIEIGQRYVSTGPSAFGTTSRNIWIVSDVRRAVDGALYANLVNEKDRGRKKMISLEALVDERFYMRVPEEVGAGRLDQVAGAREGAAPISTPIYTQISATAGSEKH